ncbi:MAG: HAMP domain-containing histidine kinase [Oscillospiraceae bacterium]|nr:HAMP domain-containing histidine kinase [Oscillospiraceae bacterium]
MKKKLFTAAFAFCALFIAAVLLLTDMSKASDMRSEQIVAVNEISQLIQSGDTDLAVQKAELLQDKLRTSPYDSYSTTNIILCIIALLFISAVFVYVYINILRPFDKMKDFAARIARGDLEVPLEYERSDYFGAFTWAFDSMRNEIIRSRRSEHEAIENNKTVIATLSHDIKTPIASIRAYAEGLEANLDAGPERRARYLAVLMRKCDEVSSLTNDLLLHSLSDMDKLQMHPEDINIVQLMEEAAVQFSAEKGDVVFHKPDYKAYIYADKKRILQLAENLINNARKYARSDTDISMIISDNDVDIHFCDTGDGIPDEDMPFITDKFYRGRNCGSETGSGLGLYIVRYITEQSGGKLTLSKRDKGLDVSVSFPLKKTSGLTVS